VRVTSSGPIYNKGKGWYYANNIIIHMQENGNNFTLRSALGAILSARGWLTKMGMWNLKKFE